MERYSCPLNSHEERILRPFSRVLRPSALFPIFLFFSPNLPFFGLLPLPFSWHAWCAFGSTSRTIISRQSIYCSLVPTCLSLFRHRLSDARRVSSFFICR